MRGIKVLGRLAKGVWTGLSRPTIVSVWRAAVATVIATSAPVAVERARARIVCTVVVLVAVPLMFMSGVPMLLVLHRAVHGHLNFSLLSRFRLSTTRTFDLLPATLRFLYLSRLPCIGRVRLLHVVFALKIDARLLLEEVAFRNDPSMACVVA